MRDHDDSVVDQFDSRASAYLASAVHAAGPDLAHAIERVQTMPCRATMLDVGCGAGHLSFALAPYFERAVAMDLSPAMLATVRTAAAQRNLPHLEVERGSAEGLPFADGTFDLACSRYSAHHWHDVPRALREMRRVLRRGGMLLMIDILGDESPLVDTHLQAIELLRDPSHVRDYSSSQWRALLQAGGFALHHEACWPTRLDFNSWVERMGTPPASVGVIRNLLAGASSEVRAGLAVETDGSFVPRTGLFHASVPA